MKKIYLSKPNSEFSFENINSDEKNVFKFERVIENYLGIKKHVIALNSGTSAIHLALILANVVKDDEVLCQSFTFTASANPIVYQGAKPVFVDSEFDTWNMCPILLEKAILDRLAKGIKPKAIIFVHLYGMPAKVDEISAIAKKYKIILIEDAAEALGSSYKGRKCGTFGDFGVFSFNNNKIITTFGGGVLVCNTKKDRDKAVFLSRQARDEAPHYQHSEIGYNYRISSVLAGVGVEQFKMLDENILSRRKINTYYNKFFTSINGITTLEEFNYVASNHWLSCILIDEKITGFTREDLRLLFLENNIETRPFWKPMHLQPVFKDCIYYSNEISSNLFKNGLCLPSSSDLSKTDLNRIIFSLKKLL